MSQLRAVYRDSLALLTDLYQLTMAYAHWSAGTAQREAVFHLYFRHAPYGGAFCLACGMEAVSDYLSEFRFADNDLAYLETLQDTGGAALFPPSFLEYLSGLELRCEVLAVDEGTAVFPQEPLLRVQGPVIEAQLLETPLLNLVSFPTLIATKAARVCAAAAGDQVLEFGLRRAQGIDGGLTASRAAYVGGCAATSNMQAGKLFGIPVRGTHAHSWVLCFDDELEAFDTYARAMPDNCVFLVDTFETVAGVRNAIEIGRRLRRSGHEMLGIRLDSGHLPTLAATARQMLDEAGFTDARIVASGDLDELRIAAMRDANAPINIWGVGTRLVTGHGQPALDTVYKLGAIRHSPTDAWEGRRKTSDDPGKATLPGRQQVIRYGTPQAPLADRIVPDDGTDSPGEPLLKPLYCGGRRLRDNPPLPDVRRHAMAQYQLFSAFDDYPVVVDERFFQDR